MSKKSKRNQRLGSIVGGLGSLGAAILGIFGVAIINDKMKKKK